MAWLAFLRKQEIRNLELCDLEWQVQQMVIHLRKTKNDTKSECRDATLCYAEGEDSYECMLTVIKEYVEEMHGSTEPREGCTKGLRPAEPCKVCPPLFPTVCANKVKVTPLSDTSLGVLVKKAFKVLEEAGSVPLGTASRMSANSMRRGGNTIAAAQGIRRAVRKKHGRWQSEGMPDEYDDFAPGEDGAVSRALQKRVREC